MKAPDVLRKAAQHIEDRAAARDKPEGERSMAGTVAAFNALTGHRLSERDGWLFMAVLKIARACNTPTGTPDDYEDLAAYAALAGESAAVEPVREGRVGAVVINVEGIGRVTVPTGYRWIARDYNGSLWAYTDQPIQSKVSGWMSSSGKAFRLVEARTPCENWHETLVQVRK